MKNTGFRMVKWLLAAYLVITVALPLVLLFANIRAGDIRAVVTSPQFLPMLGNSVFTTLAATVISVGLSFILAFCIHRSGIRFKGMWSILFTIPMLIPSISHGMGLVLLFGDNGIITNLLGINIGLYGYTGIIMGSVMYSFPVSFLLLSDAFQYEDYTTYEAAQVLGISKPRQFAAITLPNMRQALVSSVLAVFTMVFTDYGVPLTTGGKVMTLPVYMYREVIGLMNFSSGAFVGVVLLAPAFIAFLLDLKKSGSAVSGNLGKPVTVKKSPGRDALAYLVCIVTLIGVCLPILAFGLLSVVSKYPVDMQLSLENIGKAFSKGAGTYLVNSITIALLAALVGTILAYFFAYVTARTGKTLSNKLLHLLSMISLAIPGIVLGLSYVFTFKSMPFYSTILILVIVNIVHFFSSPYLLAYNSLLKMNRNLEDVADTLGISRFRMLCSVYIPSTKETIMEMYSYIFVNCMITISAVSFLANFKTMPLALLIPQMEAQSFLEGTAVISLVILAVNLLEKLAVFLLHRYTRRQDTRGVGD